MDCILEHKFIDFVFIDKDNGLWIIIEGSSNDTMENIMEKYYEDKYKISSYTK
jgi:hypothetical protein